MKINFKTVRRLRAQEGEITILKGAGFSWALPVLTEARVPLITGRIETLPFSLTEKQPFFDLVATESVSPTQHPISDPLIPSCVVYTHKAVKSGLWSDSTVWDTGTVPHSLTDGTAVVCTGVYDIVYDMFSDVRIKDIHVNGQGSLKWDTTKRTRLWVDTVLADGILAVGDVGAPIPDTNVLVNGIRQPTAEIIHWASEAPLKTVRLGFNTMAPARIQGVEKKTHAEVHTTLSPGQTSFNVPGLAQFNWKVGDRLLMVATEAAGSSPTDATYRGPTNFWGPDQNLMRAFTQTKGFKLSQDEEVHIVAISGENITINKPLQYFHRVYTKVLPRGQTVTVRPVVANMTRSIMFRTANSSDTVWQGDLSDLQKRAHMMFMFSDDVQLRYFEVKDMGRTDVDPSLKDPFDPSIVRYASNQTTVITNENNVTGRYSIHLHRNGNYNYRNMVVLEGAVVHAPGNGNPVPGWGITQHETRASIEKCIVYNVRGAGIVSETGSEQGQWLDNLVCWARGDGFDQLDMWGQRTEVWNNHHGHGGVAYENQARQILMIGNLASSCWGGWVYNGQSDRTLFRSPDQHSLRIKDPLVKNKNGIYGGRQAQIPHFDKNHTWDTDIGILVAHRIVNGGGFDRTDSTPWPVHSFHCINCNMAFRLTNYSYNYYFYDSFWKGKSSTSGAGARFGPVSWQFCMSNIALEDFANPVGNDGLILNYNGFFVDVSTTNVPGAWPKPTITVTNAADAVANHPHRNVMGPWSVKDATTVQVRDWAPLTVADLPQPYPGPSTNLPLGPEYPVVPFGGQPYFVLNPTSTLTLSSTGTGLSIEGTIRDCAGDRKYPDHQSSESSMSVFGRKAPRTAVNNDSITTTSIDVAKRNGVFYDGSTLKSRLWFVEVDRISGVELIFNIDLTLTGVPQDVIDSCLLDDPDSKKPELYFKPEESPKSAVQKPAVTPTITVPSSITSLDGVPLGLRLQAQPSIGYWTLSGPDASKFEVTGGLTLNYLNNRVYSTVETSSFNGIFNVSLTFKDRHGNESLPKPIVVQVKDFEDTFDGPAGTALETTPFWTLTSGTAGNLVYDGNGNLHRPGTGAVATFRGPQVSSYDVRLTWTPLGQSTAGVMLRYLDNSNYLIARWFNSPNCITLHSVTNGVTTFEAAWTPFSNTLYALDIVGNTATLKSATTGNIFKTVSTSSPANPAGLDTATITNPPIPSYNTGILSNPTPAFIGSVKFTPLSAPEALYIQNRPLVPYQNMPYEYTPILLGSRLGGAATWTVSSGTLPAGFTLNSATGVVSGTFTTLGPQPSFTIRATNSLESVEEVISLDVQATTKSLEYKSTRTYTTWGTSHTITSVDLGAARSDKFVVIALEERLDTGGTASTQQASAINVGGKPAIMIGRLLRPGTSGAGSPVSVSYWAVHAPQLTRPNVIITRPAGVDPKLGTVAFYTTTGFIPTVNAQMFNVAVAETATPEYQVPTASGTRAVIASAMYRKPTGIRYSYASALLNNSSPNIRMLANIQDNPLWENLTQNSEGLMINIAGGIQTLLDGIVIT